MSHVHSQKIRRAFYVAGILTGMFLVPEMPVDAANLMGILPRLIPAKATALQPPLNRTSVIPGLNSRSAVPGRLAAPRSSMQISPAALAATMKCSGN